MDYIEIDFIEVKGFNKLSEPARKLFERVYMSHNSIHGLDYKKNWIPVKVKESRTHLRVDFINGQWLHYYPNGTWG